MNDTPKNKPEMKEAAPAQPGKDAVESTDSGRPWILGMAGAVMLVVGLVIGSVLWSAPKMTQYVEPMLRTVDSGEYARAYAQVAPEWRAVTSQQEFEILHRNLHQVMGKFISLRQTEHEEFEQEQLGTMARVVFIGTYENGNVTITSLLRKTNDGWSIVGMGYDSPQLLAAMRQVPADAAPAGQKPAATQAPQAAPVDQAAPAAAGTTTP